MPSRKPAAAVTRPATNTGGDAWRRRLCASLFDDPAGLADALMHPVENRFDIEPHTHPDLLQFDVIDGCAGRTLAGGRWHTIHGTTLLVNYPAERHGYQLLQSGSSAMVYHFKIRSPHNDKTSRQPPLPRVLSGLPRLDRLSGLLSEAIKHRGIGHFSGVGVAQIAQVICAWPESGRDIARPIETGKTHRADAAAVRVRKATEALSHRYDDPPDLTELARHAKLSPRHFARQFMAEYGCTPHAYVTARRLDAARSLLLNEHHLIHEVADELGFSSPAAFSRWFTRLAGQSPKQYRDDPTQL